MTCARSDVRTRAAGLTGVGAAMLAASVLADSAMEHYRGPFHDPAMWTPLATAGLGLTLAVPTVVRAGAVAPSGRRQVGHAATALSGAVGLGFHLHNMLKRPGGLRWNNLFYAAPPRSSCRARSARRRTRSRKR